MNASDYEIEPIPGLPEPLPAGEHILWQGAPEWRRLALRAFHLRALAVYCGVFIGIRAVLDIVGGHGLTMTLVLLALPLTALGLFALMAWLFARTTMYTITNRRIVMRFGVAVPMVVNLPFKRIAAASVQRFADGSGDLAVTLAGNDHLAYLHMWPNVRPWHVRRPQPSLRALPKVERAADILAHALAAEHGQTARYAQPEADAGASAPLPAAA